MRPSFAPRLVNGPLYDPVVYTRILNEKDAVLFDCGHFFLSGAGLANKEILLINSIFVSHAHMDHFMGFDYVLRVILHRDKPLHVYGPEGITDKVLSKLRAYTWNLTMEYMLEVNIHEIQKDEILISSASVKDGFRKVRRQRQPRQGNLILRQPRYTIEAVALKHNTLSLGFVMKERLHVNIRSEVLAKKGYRAGPWVGRLKEMILEDETDGTLEVETVSGQKDMQIKDIIKDLVIISPGQKLTYLTDIRYSKDNLKRIEKISSGTDLLFIEAFYLDELKKEAYAKGHLTAAQAGEIARMVGAKKVVPMHISPRYHDQVDIIQDEISRSQMG
jgi:ribonuclease Z